MQSQTVKWEPSTEKMYVRDVVLTNDITMALLLKRNVKFITDVTPELLISKSSLTDTQLVKN